MSIFMSLRTRGRAKVLKCHEDLSGQSLTDLENGVGVFILVVGSVKYYHVIISCLINWL